MNLFSFCFVYVYVKQLMEEEEIEKTHQNNTFSNNRICNWLCAQDGRQPLHAWHRIYGTSVWICLYFQIFMGYNLVTFLYKIIASILIGWIILPFSLTSGIIKTYQETKVKA